MFIVLLGETDISLKSSEILSCSAFILKDKAALVELINKGRISGRTRIFEVSRELNIIRETKLDFIAQDDGKKVASFANKEDLTSEYRSEVSED